MERKFKINSKYSPAGDQPKAIEALTKGLLEGADTQTLLGITGSGKTFTIANVIEKIQKPKKKELIDLLLSISINIMLLLRNLKKR